MTKQILSFILLFVLLKVDVKSQITPACPSPYVYMDGGGTISFYNPALPLSASNPSSTGIPTFGTGLTLMPNINGGTLSPTFYSTSGGNYYYWSGTSWVNTGNSTGNGAAVNIGGCGTKIYNLVGGTGQVYVYNGTGNGTLLTTITGFNGGGPYDIVTDCNCNFYILNTTTSGPGQSLTMYSPTGVATCSYNLVGMPNASAGGGFAIIGNMIYVKNNLTNGFFIGTLSGSTVTFTQVTGFTASPGDFASCPVCMTLSATATTQGTLGCSQTTASVIATTTVAGATYTWSGPGVVSGGNTATATVNQPGTYNATISAGNCPPTQTVVTTVVTGTPATIIPTITASGSITCTNTLVTLSVAPNTSTNNFTWSGPGIVSGQSTPTIVVNTAGLYSVAISNSVNACAGGGSINIVNTQGPLTLTLNPLNAFKCSAAPAIGHTLTGASAYVWSPTTSVTSITANTFSLNPPVTTSYTITGTTGVCSGTLVTTVSVTPSPTVSILVSSNTLCAQNLNGSNNSIMVSANGATSYTWATSPNVLLAGSPVGAPGQLIPQAPYSSVLSPATITVTGANGVCSNTATISVNIIPNPTVSIAPSSTSICQGSSQPFTAAGASNYVWSPVTGLNTGSGPNVVANPTTTSIYSVIGESAGCFAATQSATLTILPNPTITINPATPTVCSGSSINLVANGATAYAWSPGTGLSSTNASNVSAGPMATQAYTVLGTLNTCTSLGYVTVTVIPVPSLLYSITEGTICRGYSSNINVNGASGYSWSPSSGLSTNQGPFVIASPVNSTTYTVVGYNGLCLASAVIPVEVIPQPSLSVSASAFQICEGNNVTLNAFGAQSYSWSPNTGLSSTYGNIVTAGPLVTTNYTIVGTNSSGTVNCSQIMAYSVVVTPMAEANVSGSVSICLGDSRIITVNGANTYSWVPSDGLNVTSGPAVSASPSITTVYTVVSSYNGDCAATGTVLVKVNPLPYAYAGKDTVFNLDDYKSIKAIGSGTLTWIDGEEIWCKVCPETQIFPTRSGCYIVQAENQYGCFSTDEVCVDITKDFGVYIPNAFTPNGDGVNDIFYVYGYSITDVKMTIFDRWGEKIFFSADQTVGWPGTYQGAECKNDVYVYKVEYKGLDGKLQHKTGHVTINR